jgi:hypothetical protein
MDMLIPLLRRDNKLSNCDGASSVQKISGKSAMKENVRKIVILGDSHSWGLSEVKSMNC